MGPSGSGKSTLMHIMAGLDSPTSGRAWLGDTEITELSDAALTVLRRRRVGFVFQSFNLVPTLDVRGNVLLPFELDGRRPTATSRRWIDELVDALGLAPRLAPPAARALGRPAAARRHRPRPRHPPRPGLRRRADRQPRLPHRPRGARACSPTASAALRADDRDGDARPDRGELRRPHPVPRRRAHRRATRRGPSAEEISALHARRWRSRPDAHPARATTWPTHPRRGPRAARSASRCCR